MSLPASPARTSDWSIEGAFRQCTTGLGLLGLDGRWLDLNPAAAALFGRPRAWLIGRPVQAACIPADAVSVMERIARVLRDGMPAFVTDVHIPRLDGSRTRLRLEVSVVRTGDGRPDYLCTTLADVTADHRTREERDAFFDLSADPLAIAVPDGRIVQVNAAWTALLGWTSTEMAERPLIDFVHPDDRARTLLEQLQAFDGRPTPRFRNRFRASGGGHRWLEWHSRQGDDGRLYCTARDVTEQQQALLIFEAEMQRRRQALEEAEQRLGVHVNNTPLAVVEFDDRLRVRRWSSRAEALFGWSEEEVVGDRPDQWRFIHEDDADAVATAMLSLVSGESPSQVIRNRNHTRCGAIVHCEWFMSAVFDDQGRLVSMLAFAQDVSARVAAEAEAAEREALFRATFEQAPVGIAHVGLDGRWLRVNDTLCRLLGHEAEALLGLTFQTITHPDDLDADLQHVAELLDGRIERYEMRKRYLHREGHEVWAHLTVSLRRDAAGTPLHFISVIENIADTVQAEQALRAAHGMLEARVAARTRELESANRTLAVEIEQRREAEGALRESEARLRTITDNVPTMIAYVGPDLRYRFANEAYRAWFGRAGTDAAGLHLRDILGEAAFRHVEPHLHRVLAGERVSFDRTTTGGDGVERHEHVTCLPDTDAGPATGAGLRGFFVASHDVTAHRHLAQMMEARAQRDELTGLPNRAGWTRRLDAGLARAAAQSDGVAVMFLDLDDFKQVNDRHGHDVGDAVLREFAMRLAGCMGEGDTVARLSGDEFVALLSAPENAPQAAARAAEAVAAAMAVPFDIGGLRLPLTGSMGIAVQRAGPFDGGRLVRAADEAMYIAKRQAGLPYRLVELGSAEPRTG